MSVRGKFCESNYYTIGDSNISELDAIQIIGTNKIQINCLGEYFTPSEIRKLVPTPY